jgi:hypothetical protein
VEVHGDGRVFYVGKRNVAVTGHHRARVPRDNVLELVKLFEQADYYSLLDVYDQALLDSATQVSSIEIDGRRKQVRTWDGAVDVGMPLAVSEIELAIDRLSGSARWTCGKCRNTGHRSDKRTETSRLSRLAVGLSPKGWDARAEKPVLKP